METLFNLLILIGGFVAIVAVLWIVNMWIGGLGGFFKDYKSLNKKTLFLWLVFIVIFNVISRYVF